MMYFFLQYLIFKVELNIPQPRQGPFAAIPDGLVAMKK